jgi:hypothetical protein
MPPCPLPVFGRVGPRCTFFGHKVLMPPRVYDFPIGNQHYSDYLNLSYSNFIISKISSPRPLSSGDSEPGSPSSSHGEDRAAQTLTNPQNTSFGVPHHSPPYSSSTPEDGPALFMAEHATNNLHELANHSAIRSTTSPYLPPAHFGADEVSDNGQTVRSRPQLVFLNSNALS